MVDGSGEDIWEHAGRVLEEMKGRPFIMGSDCTLPTDISRYRIRQVVRCLDKK